MNCAVCLYTVPRAFRDFVRVLVIDNHVSTEPNNRGKQGCNEAVHVYGAVFACVHFIRPYAKPVCYIDPNHGCIWCYNELTIQ